MSSISDTSYKSYVAGPTQWMHGTRKESGKSQFAKVVNEDEIEFSEAAQ